MAARIAKGDGALAEAAALLRQGELVGMPTETVYGLAGDARSDSAVARIFEAKGRPTFNPLICHAADVAVLAEEVLFGERASALAERYWPGPLTLVLPRRADARVSMLASAGLDTLAVRIPNHPVALSLLRTFGGPIVAPSANKSGGISPTRAEHVASDLDHAVSLVLEGGACELGLESTVLDVSLSVPRLLRPGAVSRSEVEELLGPIMVGPAKGEPNRSPGMLSRHYAPNKPLRTNATSVLADEALLAFGPDVPDGSHITLNLSPTGDVREAAANLFSMLRRLDDSEARAIAAMPISGEGLAEAIRDRLHRASKRLSSPA